ncbi:MAG: DUF1214 domain-containing protein [Bacteroidales bacterium]
MQKETEITISSDSKGHLLEGGKNYKLYLPPGIPASDFWSIIVYDAHSRLMIRTDQPWPSVFSSDKNLIRNDDHSVEAWFGPESLKGKEHNWIKTRSGINWYMILRLYYPLDSWFDRSWRPGEIEKII